MATTSYSYDCATTVALPVRATCSVSPRPRAAAWAPPPTATTPSARPSTSSTAGAAHTAPPTTPTAGPPTSLYDALGNLARTVTNSYDPDGFLTGRTDTAGGTSTTTGYSTDAYSRSTAKLDPGAGPVSCSDADNPADYSGAQTGQQYRYDPAGNLRSSCDSGGTSTYRYDTVNQLASYTDALPRGRSWTCPGGGHESCPLAVMGSPRHDVVCLAACRGWGPSPGALAALGRTPGPRS